MAAGTLIAFISSGVSPVNSRHNFIGCLCSGKLCSTAKRIASPNASSPSCSDESSTVNAEIAARAAPPASPCASAPASPSAASAPAVPASATSDCVSG
eukprot:7383895-Prymnesium_polylepis.1